MSFFSAKDRDPFDTGAKRGATHEMASLEEIFVDRLRAGASSMLDEIYAAAYCAGQGVPDPIEHSEPMRQLLWLLADRHRADHPPILHDELPGWLLSLANQVERKA